MPAPSLPDPRRTVDLVRSQSSNLLRYGPTMATLEFWLAALESDAAGSIPGFDPIDAPCLLSYLYILERHGDRLRYRVSGESVNQLFGSNHAGKWLDEVVPKTIYPTVEPYFHDVFDLKACVMKGHVALASHPWTEFERMLLPVFRNGELQILGSLALSNTAPLRTDGPLPDRAGRGFFFTQIDLDDGSVTERSVPLSDFQIEQMPFIDHARRRARPERINQAVAQRGSETGY